MLPVTLQVAGTIPVNTGIVHALKCCVGKAVVLSNQPGPTQAGEINPEDIRSDVRAMNLSMHQQHAAGN